MTFKRQKRVQNEVIYESKPKRKELSKTNEIIIR